MAKRRPSTPTPTPSLPSAPVYFPSESDFLDPLRYIASIRLEAELAGICVIVPPPSWKPPFALNLSSFSFPTKSQSIHRLQARPPACDPQTFDLDYERFLTSRGSKRSRRRIVFEGEDLDLCRLFNAVKRFGGYEKACDRKKWGDVFRLVMEDCTKVSECSKHVLCQLYREHLFDYEEYRRKMEMRTEKCKRGRASYERKRVEGAERKRRRGKSEKEVNVVELDQICEQCRSGLHGEVMLLCDRCDKGWHLHCLSPPLDRVPAGNWYCLECVNLEGDGFGFVPGKRCSLDEFRRMNERTRRKWFGPAGASGSQMEKRFWEIVEGKAGELEVMYGSDLDTSLHGSGFPREGDSVPLSVDGDLCKEYVSSPWNLNNFPKLQGSLLRMVDDNIAGVMVPWLYIGMLFSSFCWHIEDHCFYSINYLHWGEPKCWYGIPANKAEAFEQVMRSTLPDLFDVQPDLLFQLVTMLNPSALVDNGVPVYRALQEPGNFVITFPRSYHGGFNFGLNCAEAVNFAPADWLPHGGFGAEQYQLYRKAAVLSHEELIYVVAKSGFDSKVSSYLKKELQRMFIKEKNQRDMIYERGIIKSSSMPPREHPNKIGIEEDPTCIICQQYLYLSAVVCNCRPSTFVCLEHWNLLCECNCEKHRLLYRHSLAELGDLIEIECHEHNTILGLEDRLHDADLAENGSCFVEPKCLMEKIQVIGDYSSLKQLADSWLCNARQILQIPFSNNAYASALEKAEQFLWRDHDMDVVRDMVNKLVKAQKWAVDLKMCLAKVDGSSSHTCASDRVSLAQVNDLLNVNPLPCNEPGYLKLKGYADDATMLSIQLESTLSSLSDVTIDELESLYSKTTESPLYLAESERLANALSSAKLWIDGVRQCCLGKRPSSVEIDTLNKFKQEMMELHIKLPEARLLLEVSREADVLVLQCQKVLASPLKMKELELFLDGAVGVIISIPELELLRKHHHDALSWISQLHDFLDGLNDREDHSDIVMEITGILQSGRSLKVQVDELHLAEKELIKSCCREKASKALSGPTPLEDLLQLITDATTLHIEREEMFQQLSKNVVAALAWEDEAKFILGHMAPKSEFEDLLRISDSMPVILPSCQAVQEASLFADAWETRCHPFFSSCDTSGCALDMLLKIDDLKVLISQSALLKVDTETPRKLQCLLTDVGLLTDVERWERKTSFLIIDSLSLLCMTSEELRVETDVLSRIEGLLFRIDSAIEVGVSLRFDFNDLPRLEDISLTMKWSQKVLCSCSESPLMEDINGLVEGSEQIPIALMENSLMTVLMKGLGCLKKALALLSESQISSRCSLEAVEGIIGELEKHEIKFPVVAAQLQEVADKHKSWLEKVQSFLLTKSPEDSWSLLLKLNKLAESDALACPELENVLLETKKFQKWVTHYHEIMKPSAGDFSSLSDVLTKIKQSLDRALCIYHLSRGCGANPFSVCCSSDSRDEDTFTCLSCHDRYHLSCMGPPLATAGMIHEYSCPFCLRMETGTIPKNREQPLIRRRDRPELKAFLDHFSAGEDFYFGVQVRDLVKEIASKASQCSSYLAPIVSEALDFHGKDLSPIGERLLTALKAVAVAGIYDHSDCCGLESALAKNFWKIRAKKIVLAPHKPSFQRIQSMIKQGVALNVTMSDHFMCELVCVKEICLQWADLAREIALDSGALELRRVFEVINEGENLPVYMDKEMKLLKSRSVLYCICRRPYDRRPMIACDQCNEWYHFGCIELQVSPPKIFFCPACKPLDGELLPITLSMEDEPSCIEEAPKTPPPRKNESRRTSSRKAKPSQRNTHAAIDGMKSLTCPNETYRTWRDNRRCATRTAKRRRHFESLLFFVSQL